MTVRREARAKLNLRLRVLGREESGYHAVETLMIGLALADLVSVERGPPGIRVVVDGENGVPEGPENLCWQAAELLYRELDLSPAVVIRLEKRIPVSAGLGGGSMDAAAVLVALTELLERDPDPDRLIGLAGALGTDVPYGLCRGGLALGWERGRRLMPLAAPPSRPVLIARPPFGIRAADSYAWLARDRAGSGPPSDSVGALPEAILIPEPAALTDWDVLGGLARNDLEGPVFRRHPELAILRDALSDAGARIALLCGSGACVAGIFESEECRDRAERALQPTVGARLIRTSTLGPPAG
ncbi:MAG: 4-(cytidine 5'-diphospho)-2-C-methyl-D-erythritol kinase [Gemmatimonadota bacterium]